MVGRARDRNVHGPGKTPSGGNYVSAMCSLGSALEVTQAAVFSIKSVCNLPE